MLGLPDLNRPRGGLSGLQFLVREDEVAEFLSETQERLVMTDPVDRLRVDGISRRLVQGCWLDDGVIYAGRCRLNLPTGRSRQRLEEDKSQITQWAQHCGRNQMRTLDMRVCYRSRMKTDTRAFVKSRLVYPQDMVAERSEEERLQLRPTPRRPEELVLSDVESEFLVKKGTAARLVAVESTTDRSQPEEQTERADAVLREEYVRHVVPTGEMSWLKLLGAVQSSFGLHLCSASGCQPLLPRGVASQGRGEVCSVISGFAKGRQVLYAGVAESLAELLKLKLMPLIWWKIRRTKGHRRVQRYKEIFEMKKYRLHLTLQLGFRHSFQAGLVSPERTRLRGAPSADRQQYENEDEMGKTLVHRQADCSATDKRIEFEKNWKGETSDGINSELERGVWHCVSRIQEYEGGLNPPMRTSGLIGGGELLQP